jgi:hypothetical protein
MIHAIKRSIARLLLLGVTLWCAFGVSEQLVQAFEAPAQPSCCCKTARARAKMACAKKARATKPHTVSRDNHNKKCCGTADCQCGLSAGESPGTHEGALAVTSSTVVFAAALPAKIDAHVRLPLVRGPDLNGPPLSPPKAPPAQRRAHISGPPTYLRLLCLRD